MGIPRTGKNTKRNWVKTTQQFIRAGWGPSRLGQNPAQTDVTEQFSPAQPRAHVTLNWALGCARIAIATAWPGAGLSRETREKRITQHAHSLPTYLLHRLLLACLLACSLARWFKSSKLVKWSTEENKRTNQWAHRVDCDAQVISLYSSRHELLSYLHWSIILFSQRKIVKMQAHTLTQTGSTAESVLKLTLLTRCGVHQQHAACVQQCRDEGKSTFFLTQSDDFSPPLQVVLY